jgi:hypothetical protein
MGFGPLSIGNLLPPLGCRSEFRSEWLVKAADPMHEVLDFRVESLRHRLAEERAVYGVQASLLLCNLVNPLADSGDLRKKAFVALRQSVHEQWETRQVVLLTSFTGDERSACSQSMHTLTGVIVDKPLDFSISGLRGMLCVR